MTYFEGNGVLLEWGFGVIFDKVWNRIGDEKLLFYEEKLGLYKKDKKTKAKIDEIKDENLRKLVYEVLK